MYSGIFLSKETFENDGDAIRDFVIDRSIDRSIRREISKPTHASMHRTLNARTSLPVLADFSFSFGDDEKGKHPSSSSSSLLLLFGWRAGIFVRRWWKIRGTPHRGGTRSCERNVLTTLETRTLATDDIYISLVENFLVFLRVHRDNSRTIDCVARPE